MDRKLSKENLIFSSKEKKKTQSFFARIKAYNPSGKLIAGIFFAALFLSGAYMYASGANGILPSAFAWDNYSNTYHNTDNRQTLADRIILQTRRNITQQQRKMLNEEKREERLERQKEQQKRRRQQEMQQRRNTNQCDWECQENRKYQNNRSGDTTYRQNQRNQGMYDPSHDCYDGSCWELEHGQSSESSGNWDPSHDCYDGRCWELENGQRDNSRNTQKRNTSWNGDPNHDCADGRCWELEQDLMEPVANRQHQQSRMEDEGRCMTYAEARREVQSLTREQKTHIDTWLAENGYNKYGDEPDRAYIGTTPLYNEFTGERINRYVYILANHCYAPLNQYYY